MPSPNELVAPGRELAKDTPNLMRGKADAHCDTEIGEPNFRFAIRPADMDMRWLFSFIAVKEAAVATPAKHGRQSGVLRMSTTRLGRIVAHIGTHLAREIAAKRPRRMLRLGRDARAEGLKDIDAWFAALDQFGDEPFMAEERNQPEIPGPEL